MDGRCRRILLVLATTLIAGLASAAPAAQAADCPGATVLSSVPTARAATLCLLNHERTARGLPALSTDPALESAAIAYSQAMVQQRFFAHVSPGGQTLRDRLAPYIASGSGWVTGENLAWGTGALAAPVAIVRGWMGSPVHRANVLSGEFEEIGIGIVGGTPVGSEPTTSATYTTEFGATEFSAPAGSQSRASASAAAPLPAVTKQAKRISAKQRAQISRRCRRVARRTKAGKRARIARYDRCVRKERKAASR